MGACLRGESSPFAFRLLIYAPLEIIWRMATALFLGSSPNCGLVKSPGNFFNIIVVVLVFSLSMYVSSKSLPDPSWGSACLFFYNYIHPSFIPVKKKMLIRLFRFMSEWFLFFCEGKRLVSIFCFALRCISHWPDLCFAAPELSRAAVESLVKSSFHSYLSNWKSFLECWTWELWHFLSLLDFC